MATVKELQKLIREQTQDINKRLNSYYESKEQRPENPLLKRELEHLKNVTGTSLRSDYLAMNTHKKTKIELEVQLQELRHFGEWDIFTPDAMYERSQKELKAWRSYKAHRPGSNISFETWRRMSIIYSAGGRDLMNNFGTSDDVTNTLDEAIRKGRKTSDILDAMQKVMKDNENSGKDATDYLDDLREKLDLTT